MGWSGVDAIPLRHGETDRDAVARVYADDDGQDVRRVSRDQRRWMVDAVRILDELWPGWAVVEEHREPGRRWPWAETLEHPSAPMWVALYPESITFKDPRITIDDSDWRFWWRTIRRFATLPAVIYHADDDEILDPGFSARAARKYYLLL